jgi:hypothetical protein
MKKAQLFPSLLQYNKYSVKKVQYLREVEDIEDETNGRLTVIELITRFKGITCIIGSYTSFNTHI